MCTRTARMAWPLQAVGLSRSKECILAAVPVGGVQTHSRCWRPWSEYESFSDLSLKWALPNIPVPEIPADDSTEQRTRNGEAEQKGTACSLDRVPLAGFRQAIGSSAETGTHPSAPSARRHHHQPLTSSRSRTTTSSPTASSSSVVSYGVMPPRLRRWPRGDGTAPNPHPMNQSRKRMPAIGNHARQP